MPRVARGHQERCKAQPRGDMIVATGRLLSSTILGEAKVINANECTQLVEGTLSALGTCVSCIRMPSQGGIDPVKDKSKSRPGQACPEDSAQMAIEWLVSYCRGKEEEQTSFGGFNEQGCSGAPFQCLMCRELLRKASECLPAREPVSHRRSEVIGAKGQNWLKQHCPLRGHDRASATPALLPARSAPWLIRLKRADACTTPDGRPARPSLAASMATTPAVVYGGQYLASGPDPLPTGVSEERVETD